MYIYSKIIKISSFILILGILVSSFCGCFSINVEMTETTEDTSISEISTVIESTIETTEEITTEETTEDDIEENEQFIAQGSTTLMNFLVACSNNGYEIVNPKRDDSYVTAVAKGESESFNIRYMVENQHVFFSRSNCR